MGYLKSLEIEKDDKWRQLAHSKGWVCENDGEVAMREDLDDFLAAGKLCPHCRHQKEKLLRDD